MGWPGMAVREKGADGRQLSSLAEGTHRWSLEEEKVVDTDPSLHMCVQVSLHIFMHMPMHMSMHKLYTCLYTCACKCPYLCL